MKRNFLKKLIVYCLFLWIGCLQPEGFAEHTLVRDLQGFKTIEQFAVGNCVVVVAEGGALQPYSIMRTMSYVADSFIKIYIKDICVCAAPQQMFYSCTRNEWVSAQALHVSEELLCGNGNVVCVDKVETVHKQQRMHTFTVETSHIFCVTPYEIIAHNIEPATTTGLIIGLSVTCPPAAVAVAAAEVVTFGVVGCIMYCAHRKMSKNIIKSQGCFDINGQQENNMPVGCYHPVPYVPVVCDIKAGKETETAKVTPYINPEMGNNNVACEFPIVAAEKPILHEAATKQTDCDQEKRYEGPWYHRTEDWIKDHPFGQKIAKSLERSDYTNQGKRAFKVINKIENCNGFNKGEIVVIDALHNDHLEVFGKDREWKQVANFDGTINREKTKQGMKTLRRPLERG